jgi:hypothetical protein
LAGESPHYTRFVRARPCAACGTLIRVEVHHALYGTTYSPDEPRPSKAIPNARKGAAQKSHDFFSIPLCGRDHTPGLHKMAGFFEGWTGEQLEVWERKQVEEMHKLYDEEFPNGDPALAARAAAKAARPTPGGIAKATNSAAHVERGRIVRVIRARAAERHHLPDQHQLLSELADDIASGLNDTGSF